MAATSFTCAGSLVTECKTFVIWVGDGSGKEVMIT